VNIIGMAMRTATVYILIGLVAGCGETTTTTIAEWKAEGNTRKLLAATRPGNDQDIRFAAIKALGELQAPDAADPLAALFSDDDFGVVLHAIEALANIPTRQAQEHLVAVLEMEAPRGRAMAAKALGAGLTPLATDALIKTLDDEYEPAAVGAAESLGQLGDPLAVDPLLGKLQTRSQPMRLAVVRSLAALGGDGLVDGLKPVLGDISSDVRQEVVSILITFGEQAAPVALEALKSNDPLVRQSGRSILEATGTVPTDGEGYAWYLLGETAGRKSTVDVDPAIVDRLATMGPGIGNVLLEAAAHESPEIREHAFRALMKIGQPCTAQAIAAAQARAGETGLRWYNQRANWAGAPSWRLDLWGAAVALNPNFELNGKKEADLAKKGETARSVMLSRQFKPTREYVPLLVAQFSYKDPETSLARITEHLSMAARLLEGMGGDAEYPLLAAIGARDCQTGGQAARILLARGIKEANPAIAEAFRTHLEEGATLCDSPLYEAMLAVAGPDDLAIVDQVRPNATRARQIFEQQYPGLEKISVLGQSGDSDNPIAPVVFRISYSTGGRSQTMKVIFKRFGDGTWKPDPALPDALPD